MSDHTTFACFRCGDRMGIAGGGDVWTDDDYDAQEHFDNEVRRHRDKECRVRRLVPRHLPRKSGVGMRFPTRRHPWAEKHAAILAAKR